MTNVVTVKLWDEIVGYLGYVDNEMEVAVFEYDESFLKNSNSPSPIKLPLTAEPFVFDRLGRKTFHGLPGFIADSLPDKFGNQLIDQYFAKKGIASEEITALDRLLYIGDRAMGALSYEPHENFGDNTDTVLDIQSLSELSNMVLRKKEDFQRELGNAKQEQAIKLLKVGSSAGGARSKALVAIDKDNVLHDGTLLHSFQCTYHLLKFDSDGNSDKDKEDPKGMTKIEYIYSILARNCEILVPSTDYIEHDGDFHFLIERFDRFYFDGHTAKYHYVSWCGIAHADRDGAFSYEQLVLTARELGLTQDAVSEIFKRAVFNIVGRNQDDHTKNFGFLMDSDDKWILSPAFDLTYSYDPTGKWTSVHQISLNGKRDGFKEEDIVEFGKYCNLSKKKSLSILKHTIDAFGDFKDLADKYNVSSELKETILQNLRLDISKGI